MKIDLAGQSNIDVHHHHMAGQTIAVVGRLRDASPGEAASHAANGSRASQPPLCASGLTYDKCG